jgi:hypothetical protein
MRPYSVSLKTGWSPSGVTRCTSSRVVLPRIRLSSPGAVKLPTSACVTPVDFCAVATYE